MGEVGIIDRLINSFRRSLKNEADSYECSPDLSISPNSFYYGSELRKLVLDPLIALMRKGNKLFIAADGGLNTLPFETLPLTLSIVS